MIRDKLNNLKQDDVYSLMLFCLFKMTENKNYASLCELIYVIDKDNLLNLCEFFGGTTITIPTIKQLEELVNGLLLYDKLNIENKSYEESIESIKNADCDMDSVKKVYETLCECLSDTNLDSMVKLSDRELC